VIFFVLAIILFARQSVYATDPSSGAVGDVNMCLFAWYLYAIEYYYTLFYLLICYK